MSFNIFLSLSGQQQGLISAGCNTMDSIGNRCQKNHPDEIQVLSLNHGVTREQHCNHLPVDVVKPIDKSSPLIALAVSNNEKLTAIFQVYWLNQSGVLEVFYEVKLTNATIISLSSTYPHVINSSGIMPYESLSLKYESITWAHKIAGTSGYSIWDDRVY
ncbi:Hcp family type VI secretion system effector [Serratia fonticola]|uniref:Hcp family type VI secretion system effector n=1 Tax=Serratia fonticola TaxID=47917 RepID=UPI0015C598CA|nr:Hcp family type VI secretion system effector [Serratia fonticola]MBC3381917.1 Hcp family type VI secretion system effector [Serratia fonticola]NYA41116.1 Hcp family type VI secretion system effector [Serratia fonticola]